MIGFLTGKIISKNNENNQCTILSDKVGYEVTITKGLFERLSLDEETSLWIHTHMREDSLSLIGFSSELEKQIFRLLLTVSGLGPKSALSLISEHGAHGLINLIMSKNSSKISAAHGIGKKIADRIILELLPKLEKMPFILEIKNSPSLSTNIAKRSLNLKEDLVSALSNLGYQIGQIRTVVDKIIDDNSSFEELLKACLSELSGRVLRKEQLHG